MVEGTFTEADKLLICLAIILLLTIVWTLLIGIMYKMRERNIVAYKKNHLIEDEENEEDEEDYVSINGISDLETYVKIRFSRTDKNLIYIAPKRIQLEEGQKIKVRVDDDTVKNATVIKGNYIREKYKNNYKELELEY